LLDVQAVQYVLTNAQSLNTFVLVVDDEPSVHEVVRRALRAYGFTSAHATTTTDAIVIAQQQDIAAVVLDLGLAPADTGLNFLVWLRLQPWYVDVPVVILTGRAHVGRDEQDLIRRHRAHLLHKPHPMESLMGLLQELIACRG
jgi:DNA-binding response OmpR family regulator